MERKKIQVQIKLKFPPSAVAFIFVDLLVILFIPAFFLAAPVAWRHDGRIVMAALGAVFVLSMACAATILKSLRILKGPAAPEVQVDQAQSLNIPPIIR